MASRQRDLEVTVRHHGRREDRFDVPAIDPADRGRVRDILRGWLQDRKWATGRWGEFELDVREADQGPRVRFTVKAR